MRLFVAILFSPAVRGALQEGTRQLREQSLSGSFTRPENLHLTLAFLGETEKRSAAERACARAAAGCAPFSIALQGTGRFGDLWWAGLAPCPPLAALAQSLAGELRGEGFALESRPFRPHITLARRVSLGAPPRLEISPVGMQVEKLSLMRSDRGERGMVYREIGAFPLQTRRT